MTSQQHPFSQQNALQNIVARILLAKGPQSNMAVARVEDFLNGGKELSRDEKDQCFIDSNAAYATIVDYNQLERFSYRAFLPRSPNCGEVTGPNWRPGLYPNCPDYSLDASWIDSDGAYAYTMSMHLNVLNSCTSTEFTPSRHIQCPSNKNWVVGYIQWHLAAAPEGTHEYNWVGKSAGVEMVTGFVSHVNSKGMIVDATRAHQHHNDDNDSVGVISSKFDLIGYACFSPLELLGVDFYRFSIRKGGAVHGNTLSLFPAVPWQNPMVGRAYQAPAYCGLNVDRNVNAALSGVGSATSIDALMASFSDLAVKVEAGNAPTLSVTDVVVAGRQHRQGRFENDWTPDVARAFGHVLKTVKRNGGNKDGGSSVVNPAKRKQEGGGNVAHEVGGGGGGGGGSKRKKKSLDTHVW